MRSGELNTKGSLRINYEVNDCTDMGINCIVSVYVRYQYGNETTSVVLNNDFSADINGVRAFQISARMQRIVILYTSCSVYQTYTRVIASLIQLVKLKERLLQTSFPLLIWLCNSPIIVTSFPSRIAYKEYTITTIA